ncbi:MAG: SRPBCC domain-containing protein [Chitinophaga sp.]|uniref:SRPBCC family protein n=1 Tax=Chitinophaga sp. TaxID=1869181 RepID=UPI001B1ED302|nr:SRPBCC domain-containing protein [Chitinophaga sp.]MBO9727375.1 SRPBCC domain-containing protein [Chitinophaga sp.]
MDKHLTMTASVDIHAPASKVWTAITDKAQIKKYFFGTDVNSDWKKGSPVTWSGEWEGQRYEEKGEVLDVEKDQLLSYSYLSTGKEDIPENYSTIIYRLEKDGPGNTHFIVSQSNFADQAACDHSKENWKQILDGLKKVAES